MKTTTEILNQPKYRDKIESDHGITVSGIKEAMEEYAKKWQPIAQLPTVSGVYLIYGSYTRDCPKCVNEAYYDHKRRRFNQHGILSKNVTHWQPLPKPPIS